jgi:hypothetical protein
MMDPNSPLAIVLGRLVGTLVGLAPQPASTHP